VKLGQRYDNLYVVKKYLQTNCSGRFAVHTPSLVIDYRCGVALKGNKRPIFPEAHNFDPLKLGDIWRTRLKIVLFGNPIKNQKKKKKFSKTIKRKRKKRYTQPKFKEKQC